MLTAVIATWLALAAARVPTATPSDTEPVWTPIVEYDEVRVAMDTSRVVGRGPYTAWLRWSFHDRAASPAVWDAGVRASLDLFEVDCVRATARTLSSTAYAADGAVRADQSLDEPAAAWRPVVPGTLGAEVAERVCGVALRRV
jgi:hypothetical protein